MEKIAYEPEVKQYLKELVRILHKREYIGFMESAQEYVDGITNDIERYLPIIKHKLTKGRIKKYGKYYASFPRKNKRTTWYVVFDKVADTHIISYITNNHVGKARDLKGL